MRLPDHGIRLTFGDSLSYGHLREVCYVLKNGGLCILPSDTCYSVAALPLQREVMDSVAQLLPAKSKDPIPLAFGSLAMVERYVELSSEDHRAIDKFCPGPITLVCPIRSITEKHILQDMLHTQGTIGVRIPDSPVERQISSELERPITTCAIRDDDGVAVKDFDEAVDIIRMRLEGAKTEPTLMAIKMMRVKYATHSTVVSVHAELASPYMIKVYRPGVIDPEEIRDTVRQYSFRDVEEWT